MWDRYSPNARAALWTHTGHKWTLIHQGLIVQEPKCLLLNLDSSGRTSRSGSQCVLSLCTSRKTWKNGGREELQNSKTGPTAEPVHLQSDMIHKTQHKERGSGLSGSVLHRGGATPGRDVVRDTKTHISNSGPRSCPDWIRIDKSVNSKGPRDPRGSRPHSEVVWIGFRSSVQLGQPSLSRVQNRDMFRVDFRGSTHVTSVHTDAYTVTMTTSADGSQSADVRTRIS